MTRVGSQTRSRPMPGGLHSSRPPGPENPNVRGGVVSAEQPEMLGESKSGARGAPCARGAPAGDLAWPQPWPPIPNRQQ